MVIRANGNSDPLALQGTTIHIVGIQSADVMGLAFAQAFGSNVRFFPTYATLPLDHSDLTIGIFEGENQDGLQTFAARARARATGVLCVRFRANEVIIGPLATARRPGCARCALGRMVAAAAMDGREARPTAPQAPGIAAAVLIREVGGIIQDGFDRSQLVDHVLIVDTNTLDESLHRVIPLPSCGVCGGAAALPASDELLSLSADDSPEVLLTHLSGWVDQRTGVISNLFVEPPNEIAAALPVIATATPPHLLEDDGSLRRLPLGWGKGFNVSAAMLSAVGEAIERYSASLAAPERIVWARAADLDGKFLDPRISPIYDDSQYERPDFPYARFDAGIEHPWVLGKWLSSNAPVWVPAVYAFLSLTLRPEQLICQGTSNGLAAATHSHEAALRATLELVERDAFMAAWLTGRSATRLVPDATLDPRLREVIEAMKTLGADVEIYILPTCVYGTAVLCMGLGDGRQYPGVTIGLGADADPRAALRQAILELGQTGPYLQRMMQLGVLSIPEDPLSVQDMFQHASYYFPLERVTAFDPLRSGDGEVVLSELDEVALNRSLADCASHLEEAGISVALVDVTSADVATGPFRVIRAVSPDLQSISYGYGLDRKPVERIQKLKLAVSVPTIHPIW